MAVVSRPLEGAPAAPLAEKAASAPRRRWFEFKQRIPWIWSLVLGGAIWAIFFALWEIAVRVGWADTVILPSPMTVLAALRDLLFDQNFLEDILVSVGRILVSFAAACLIAVPLGIFMGAFGIAEGFFNPFVSAWRYLPAPSFIPLLLMWFGAGELQKLALLFLGVVFFLITLVMDYTKSVRTELIETALTLGATRVQVLRSVIIRSAMPNVLVAMRQMLAVSWTYLVIAEIVAASNGIGAVMMRAKRFMHVDQVMAGIIIIGVLGLAFDALFRLAHRRKFRWLPDDAH
jgi:NitT/TauT family transport system permease protein